ncbi:MAG: hypothetical protein JNG88_06075 [Phycisphaerales bacterium]|nr:hypothetical protein [Phycisphaerales bacterium]
MSALPPNWIASTIGGSAAAQRSAELKRGEAAAEQRRLSQTPNQAIPDVDDVSIVSADDRISADAEGSGSQGRSFSHSGDQPSPPPDEPADNTSGAHIDMQA